MSTIIRPMALQDREAVLSMMRIFYRSPAVLSNGSEGIFCRDVDACIGSDPFLSGYILEEQGVLQGYAMIARSFSTEFGRHCIWLEDLYILPEHRGKGLGSLFLTWLRAEFPEWLLRLEVEEDNDRAVHVYEKCGFSVLPYQEMVSHPENGEQS